jgi:hypothetical protein
MKKEKDKTTWTKIGLLFCSVFFIACSDSSSDSSSSKESTEVDSDELISESFFNSTSLISYEKVDCTLEDGTTSECYQLVFSSNPIEDGPYCPETINDVGGLAVYDGTTNPGFQVMKNVLFYAMETDGYDIIDEDGNINIDDFSGSVTIDPDLSYCLEAASDNDLKLTFLIPAVPKLASSNNVIDYIELVGLSVDGVPINGDLPSVADPTSEKAGNIPSLDPCGGHNDPAGYYHWHFIPETINQVLTTYGITEVSCTNMTQATGDDVILSGFAKDGYPIYAYGTEPTDLDDCGGRTAVTPEFPDGVYHYVASNTDAINVPVCLKGVSATNSFTYQ